MICNKCGKQFEGKFCNECGTESTPKKPVNNKADLYALCVIVGIAVFSICFLVSTMLRFQNGATIDMGLSLMVSIGCVLLYGGVATIVVSNSNKQEKSNVSSQSSQIKTDDNIIIVTRADQKIKITVLLIGVFVIFALFVLVIFMNGGNKQPNIPVEQNNVSQSVLVEQQQPSKAQSTATPSETMGQKNALEKAITYLEYSAFSHSGMVKQLEFEKFSKEDAIYGADNCGADWNEQAVEKANTYLEYSSFSRDSLITQLEFDGFTNEQSVYAVDKLGY